MEVLEYSPYRHRSYLIKPAAKTLRILAPIACIATSYFLAEFQDGQYSIFLWTPIIYLLAQRRCIVSIIFLLSTPLTLSTFNYCREYARGGVDYVRPVYQTPIYPQGSLRPVSRLRGFDPGCGTHSPNHWIGVYGKEWAAEIMEKVIGPPPGAYLGPYPTQAECISLFKSGGETQTQSDIDGSNIHVGAATYKLPLYDIQECPFVISKFDPTPWSAALYKSQCLVLRIPRDVTITSYYLFDVKTGRGFAVYFDRH